MVINIYNLSGIFGLLLIIFGNFKISNKLKDRKKYVYPSFILGGILLIIYSIYIKNTIFIILQIVFVIVSVYNLNKISNKK